MLISGEKNYTLIIEKSLLFASDAASKFTSLLYNMGALSEGDKIKVFCYEATVKLGKLVPFQTFSSIIVSS